MNEPNFFAEDTDEDEEGEGEEDADSNATSDTEPNSEPDSVDDEDDEDEEGMGTNYSDLVSLVKVQSNLCPRESIVFATCLESIFGYFLEEKKCHHF